ncbi:MAG: hypothetical protein U1E08_00520 [Coriobacteriia bacterium]|nr:hypothetical protein [Coriobacteriia bacterium]
MDYFDVLKKAWTITWRYKALWVLGLFAGAASGGGGGGGGSGYRTGSSDYSTSGQEFNRMAGDFARVFQDNLVLVAIMVGVLAIIGIVFWVLSIAAQGGLVHGANEAAEERTPALGAAWRVGFRHWGRTFMIGLVLAVPMLLILGVMAAMLVAVVAGGAMGGDAGAGVAIGGACLVLPLFFVLLIAVALIIGIVYNLALRYGVLGDVSFGQAIKRGWADLWGKRGAFVFWLVMLLPGVAYSIIGLLIMLPFIVGSVALVIAEQFAIAALVFLVMIIVALVPGAIYGTFVSSAWTVFFRRMTGMEVAPVQSAPTSVYPAPPVPPAAPAVPGDVPPAPPVSGD